MRALGGSVRNSKDQWDHWSISPTRGRIGRGRRSAGLTSFGFRVTGHQIECSFRSDIMCSCLSGPETMSPKRSDTRWFPAGYWTPGLAFGRSGNQGDDSDTHILGMAAAARDRMGLDPNEMIRTRFFNKGV